MPRALSQRASQKPSRPASKATAMRLIRCRFLSPSMQQLQQCALVDSELFQRLALDARHDTGNEPARQAHLNDCDQRSVRFKSGEGSAQVVQLLHGALHRFTCDDGMQYPRRRPIASSIMGFEDEAEQSLPRPCREIRPTQADMRTHLIHRPARDIIPPLGGSQVFLLSDLILDVLTLRRPP
jgi:hypothetical protein